MTDDSSFPKAIVPTRPSQTREKFDTLARRIGDPMVKLFLLQNADIEHVLEDGTVVTRPDTEMQFRAAAELMPYRYPKLKASEVNHNGLPPGAGGGVTVLINFSPADPVIDVSPVTPPVDPLD